MAGGLTFLLSSVLFGLGLAVDAFLISLSNGMSGTRIKRGKLCADAALFAVFQFIAPLAGWLLVKTVAQRFAVIEELLAVAALAVLLFLGIKMVAEGLKKQPQPLIVSKESKCAPLLVQAMATSVDALSVGLAIAGYGWQTALVGSAIISLITFAAYTAGHFVGRKFGNVFVGGASIAGGVIFIIMAAEMFLSGV